jgi:hypothetical protein
MTALALVKPAEQPSALAVVHDTMEALKAIRTLVLNEFKPGIDSGVIPGTSKPTLLLPGAQKAMMYFNVFPTRDLERIEMGGGHLEVLCTTKLVSRASGQTVGEGSGSCSSMETKYRYRSAQRLCPKCGTPNIKTSKFDDCAFYCHAKSGGCGAKFGEHDERITGQVSGNVENPNPHEVRNTILKMGIKRADVSAAMSLACLSELFTQDLEDTYDLGVVAEAPPAPPAAAPPPAAPAPVAPPPAPPATNGKAKHEWKGKGPGAAGAPAATTVQTASVATDKQIHAIRTMVLKRSLNLDSILNELGVVLVEQLTGRQAADVISRINGTDGSAVFGRDE